jgi:aminoglycoside phosphotransferase (APT) family kinase protein
VLPPFGEPRFDPLRRQLGAENLGGATFLGEGWHARAYRAGGWVIRVPRSESACGTIERQTRLYQILRTAGMPVPRDASIVRGHEGELLAGLYSFIDSNPWPVILDPVAESIGRFLRAIHRLPIETVRDVCEVVPDLWSDRFEPRLTACRRALSMSQLRWLAPTIDRFVESGGTAGSPLALVHADLSAEHLLVDRAGDLAGVIDFNGPRIADPALDFGTLIEHLGAPFAAAAWRFYRDDVDVAFWRRAAFYADVRPLVTIELGLRSGDPTRLQQGLQRLDARRLRQF